MKTFRQTGAFESSWSRILLQTGLSLLVAALPIGAAGWVPGSQGSIVYQLFVPDTSAPGKKYPFVVYEAGAGHQGNADTLNRLMFMQLLSSSKIQTANPCFVLAPQCPLTGTGCWIDICYSETTYSIAAHPNTVSPEQDVIDAVNAIKMKYCRIDTNRIHMTGGSMGGYGAWFAVCKYPRMFASCTPISGGADTSCAKLLTGLPIWAFAQADDTIISVEGSRRMINAIKTAGGNPKYTEFNGIPTGYGYHLWDQVWDSTFTQLYQPDLLPWMFSQVRTNIGTAVVRPICRYDGVSTALGSAFIRGHALGVRANRSLTVSVLNSQGRLVAAGRVAEGAETAIPLPAGCRGVLYARIADGAHESVEPLLVGLR